MGFSIFQQELWWAAVLIAQLEKYPRKRKQKKKNILFTICTKIFDDAKPRYSIVDIGGESGERKKPVTWQVCQICNLIYVEPQLQIRL